MIMMIMSEVIDDYDDVSDVIAKRDGQTVRQTDRHFCFIDR